MQVQPVEVGDLAVGAIARPNGVAPQYDYGSLSSGQARGSHYLFLGAFFAMSPLASLATGTVTLAWDASSGTNVIANYNIYYGVASATYTNVVSAGTNLTVSVSNLVEGATYYFAATAVDTVGLESDYSTEVSTVIPVATNQAPTLNALANVTINENAGLQTVNLSGITSGATNESQTLTVTASFQQHGPDPDTRRSATPAPTPPARSPSPRSPMPLAPPPSPSRSMTAAPATTSSPAPSRSPSTRSTRRPR